MICGASPEHQFRPVRTGRCNRENFFNARHSRCIENRLDHAVSNLMNISENTEAARSRIQDADFAAESAKLAKAQVLKQAGVGMLAQANAGSQLVLQLLQ